MELVLIFLGIAALMSVPRFSQADLGPFADDEPEKKPDDDDGLLANDDKTLNDLWGKVAGTAEKTDDEDTDGDSSDTSDVGEDDGADDSSRVDEKPDSQDQADDQRFVELKTLAFRTLPGLTEADMAGFQTADQLEGYLIGVRQQLLRQEEVPAQPPAQQTPVDATELAYKLGLSEDDVDPALLKALNGMNSHYATQATQSQQALQRIVGVMQQQQEQLRVAQAQQDEAYLDSKISTLDDAVKEFFVKEPKMKIDLYETMLDMQSGRSGRNGRSPMTTDQLFKSAMAVVLGPKQEELARQTVNGKLKKRGRQATMRPQGVKETEATVSNDDKSLAVVTRGMRKLGVLSE